MYETTAFIGKLVKPGSDDATLEPAAKEKKLGDLPSWPVSIGYFEPKDGDLTPSYQIDFRLYENGVSRNLSDRLWRLLDPGQTHLFGISKPKECK